MASAQLPVYHLDLGWKLWDTQEIWEEMGWQGRGSGERGILAHPLLSQERRMASGR